MDKLALEFFKKACQSTSQDDITEAYWLASDLVEDAMADTALDSEKIEILEVLTSARQRIFDPLAIIIINLGLRCKSPMVQSAAISCLLNIRTTIRCLFTKKIQKMTKSTNKLVAQTASDYLALQTTLNHSGNADE